MDLWLFWAIAAVLAGMVAVILVQALRQAADAGDEHPDLKVYRDQLAEVDRDLDRGTLAPEEAQRLRVEVSRRLLDADKVVQKDQCPAPRGSMIWAAGLAPFDALAHALSAISTGGFSTFDRSLGGALPSTAPSTNRS